MAANIKLDLFNHIFLGNGSFLNKSTGVLSKEIGPPPDIKIEENLTIVTGVDRQKINLNIVSDNFRAEPINGFLIEVYSSGSDGRLTRLFKNDDIDLNGNITNESFSQYFDLKIDEE